MAFKRSNQTIAEDCNTSRLTSLVQPLNVAINKPFKDNLRKQLNTWMLEGEKGFIKEGQMRHTPLDFICEWTAKMWVDTKPETIMT